MSYSETKVIMGGLTHIPILIFIVNFIKGKFAAISDKVKVVEIKAKEPQLKVVEVKEDEEVKESEVKAKEPQLKVVEVKEDEEVKEIGVKEEAE